MKEAQLWERLAEDRVRCHLCAHRCTIQSGGHGICQVRENRNGTLVTLVYEQLIAQHVDPIEKKPLVHFYPGTRAYSVATEAGILRGFNSQVSKITPSALISYFF